MSILNMLYWSGSWWYAIYDLSLTNDETNEKVIVKWFEYMPANWAKTVVRYKTGSAPTSPTDWTLAVQETTKNQYSSTGYWVSWLSDNTTYYFSVFAIDSNNTIINVQSSSITTSFRPSPWSNAIVYYKFNNNLVDSINNTHPLSLTQWTAKYWTIWIRKYFEFNGNTYLSATPMIPASWPFSISVWCLWSAKNISWNVWQAFYQQMNADSNGSGSAISMYERTWTLRSRWRWTWDLDTWYSLNINTWYNIIFTYTSWTLKIYVNWTLVSTQSRTINTVSPVYFWIWRRWEYSSWTAWADVLVANWGKVSEFIAYNKELSSSEISNYYNRTKSNYWL